MVFTIRDKMVITDREGTNVAVLQKNLMKNLVKSTFQVYFFFTRAVWRLATCSRIVKDENMFNLTKVKNVYG